MLLIKNIGLKKREKEIYEVKFIRIFFCTIDSSITNVNISQRKILLEQKLRESGEETRYFISFFFIFHLAFRMEDYLRQKLIECGWKDDLKKYCKG